MRGDREVADLAGHLRVRVVADPEIDAVEHVEADALGDRCAGSRRRTGARTSRRTPRRSRSASCDDGLPGSCRSRPAPAAGVADAARPTAELELRGRARLLPGHDRSFHQSCQPRNSSTSTPAVMQHLTEHADDGHARRGRRRSAAGGRGAARRQAYDGRLRHGHSSDSMPSGVSEPDADACAGCARFTRIESPAWHVRNSSKPARAEATSGEEAPNPVWFKPVMFGFMLLGLAWIIVFYVSQGRFPIPTSAPGTSSSASASRSSASS